MLETSWEESSWSLSSFKVIEVQRVDSICYIEDLLKGRKGEQLLLSQFFATVVTIYHNVTRCTFQSQGLGRNMDLVWGREERLLWMYLVYYNTVFYPLSMPRL